MEQLIKLLIELKGAQLLLSMIIWVAIAYLTANSQPVPDALLIAGTATIAFWFGATTQKTVIERNGDSYKSP